MSNGTFSRFMGTLLLFLFISDDLASQSRDTSSVRMMFYNVENFFDVYDDTLRDDNDFLPEGLMHWNYERYRKKINSVYKVITAAGGWSPPAIIGFCEIEKRSVLEDLIFDTYLTKYGYGIVHEESPDRRGIDVCLIYRKDIAKLLEYHYFLPRDLTGPESRTRTVLYTRWLIKDDTIHLFLNHWPSKRGGVLPGEPSRISISRMLKVKVDSLIEIENGHAKIIIAGDFNSSPHDTAVTSLLAAGPGDHGLINLSDHYPEKGEGSYRYMGSWEMPDQVIVSEWLMKCDSGFTTSREHFRIFKPDFLLREDSKYPGYSPFSTYQGYRYQVGFSDHLPLILDLILK